MAFSFEIDEIENLPVFSLHGSLMERQEAQELLDEISEIIIYGRTRLILDLQHLDYLNSSGLNVLINLFTRARNANGEVVMCNINDKLQKLLVITKLDAVIQQTTNREEAAIMLKLGQSEHPKNEA